MDWHRFFGLILEDFFTDSAFVVETEIDLSKKLQLLDVAVIRKREGAFVGALPDGFDNLVDFNLVSFKSYQEALDDWAIDELLGHFVNYRKQVSPSFKDLLPVSRFGLYAVCARFPTGLESLVKLTRLRDGSTKLPGVRSECESSSSTTCRWSNRMPFFSSSVPSRLKYNMLSAIIIGGATRRAVCSET